MAAAISQTGRRRGNNDNSRDGRPGAPSCSYSSQGIIAFRAGKAQTAALSRGNLRAAGQELSVLFGETARDVVATATGQLEFGRLQGRCEQRSKCDTGLGKTDWKAVHKLSENGEGATATAFPAETF